MLISTMKDVIDTRDLQDRLTELEDIKELIEQVQNEIDAQPVENADRIEELKIKLEDLQSDFDQVEFDELTEMSNEIPEWKDGNTLIKEDYFEQYCQELCEDIGDIPKNIPTYIVIDWAATANNIKYDYSECSYKNEIYLYRNS